MASAPETSTEHAQRVDLFIFAMVGVAAAVSWARILPRINGIDVLAVTAVLGGGYPVFREALENLIARRMTMELSMTIALAAALANRRTCSRHDSLASSPDLKYSVREELQGHDAKPGPD